MLTCTECNKKIKIPKNDEEVKGITHEFHMLSKHQLPKLAPVSSNVKCLFCNEKIYYWLEKGVDKKTKDKEVLIHHIKNDH